MADDSTDSAFGFILFILFLALLGYAAGGVSSSSSTAGTPSGTSQSLPTLEGSSVSSCTGTVKQDKMRDREYDLGGDAESHAGIYRRPDSNGV